MTLPPGCTRNARDFPAVPGCAGSAKLFRAALLLLVIFAGGGYIEAEQRGAKQGDHDGRSYGAEQVGHGVSNRHRVE